MIRQQLIRISRRWQTWIALLIGLAMIVIQAMTISKANTNFINSAYVHLTGFDYTGMGSRSYFVILPLLSALAAGSTNSEDKKQRFLSMQLSRETPQKYLADINLSAFIAGGLLGIIPLILEGCYYFSKYSLRPLPKHYELSPIASNGWGAGLFFSHPFLFWLLCLLIIFVFSGLFSLIATASAAFRIPYGMEIVIPFLISIASSLARDLTGFEGLSITSIITPTFSNNYRSTFPSLFIYPALILLGVILVDRWRVHHDLL